MGIRGSRIVIAIVVGLIVGGAIPYDKIFGIEEPSPIPGLLFFISWAVAGVIFYHFAWTAPIIASLVAGAITIAGNVGGGRVAIGIMLGLVVLIAQPFGIRHLKRVEEEELAESSRNGRSR